MHIFSTRVFFSFISFLQLWWPIGPKFPQACCFMLMLGYNLKQFNGWTKPKRYYCAFKYPNLVYLLEKTHTLVGQGGWGSQSYVVHNVLLLFTYTYGADVVSCLIPDLFFICVFPPQVRMCTRKLWGANLLACLLPKAHCHGNAGNGPLLWHVWLCGRYVLYNVRV